MHNFKRTTIANLQPDAGAVWVRFRQTLVRAFSLFLLFCSGEKKNGRKHEREEVREKYLGQREWAFSFRSGFIEGMGWQKGEIEATVSEIEVELG